MVGEAAGALLLGVASNQPALHLMGTGFGVERAHVLADEALRAEGLTAAIQQALAQAQMDFCDLDFRITDLAGEHYYFKEAALTIGRILRSLKDEFDTWHPAECVGETGAAVGAVLIALADAACRKAFAPGRRILVHMSDDAGERAAAILEFRAAS
jgi:3-oxoacyl-[acyl-carrier-protein] synthase-1